jgi:hypothetical protein
LLNTVLEQSYTQFDNEYYEQNDGVAIGAPASAILAEIFIQHLEHTKIIDTLKKHYIIDYYRYVDDILIGYNTQLTDIQDTLAEFNTLHPKIQFTMETEIDNKINYLDLTIINKHDQLAFDIYRKPATTDLIIRNDSCHPYEHKRSAINFLVNRMNKYPVTEETKYKEQQTIKTILENNNYNAQAMYPKKKITQNKEETLKTSKWATFTYHGNDTRTITKLFRNTNIRIAYRTTNTIRNHLRIKNPITDMYSRSGVYQLKCKGCPLKYIGRTGRTFRTRYKEQSKQLGQIDKAPST